MDVSRSNENRFDIAIIGCGAYGLPLAAKLKKEGRQAIHLAGVTQLMFGIKGKRWEENEAFTYVKNGLMKAGCIRVMKINK